MTMEAGTGMLRPQARVPRGPAELEEAGRPSPGASQVRALPHLDLGLRASRLGEDELWSGVAQRVVPS